METNSHTPHSYVGEFTHALDDKNRITIPSWWRHNKKDEGEEFYILPGKGGIYLRVMVPAQFALMSNEVKGNPAIPAEEQTVYLRDLHRSAKHSASDKQGRLVVPELLCRYAGLKGEVLLLGGPGHFEIWNAAKDERSRESEKDIVVRIGKKAGH